MPKKPDIFDNLEWIENDDPPSDNSDGIPYVTHSGILKLGDISLTVYQLSDGMRVIDENDIHKLLGAIDGEEN